MVRFVCAALVAAILLAPSIAAAQPLPPVRLSVSTDGTQSDYPSTLKDVSADGRHVLFSTSAPLVATDLNGVLDLYVRDRDTDRDGVFDEPGAVRTILVSVGPGGEQLADSLPRSGVSTGGTLSRDGRFVLFSTLWQLVGNDTNDVTDGYLYDRDIDADGIFDEPDAAGVSLVTTGSGNTQATGGGSEVLQVTSDGRYVLFRSSATNLQPRATTVAQIYRQGSRHEPDHARLQHARRHAGRRHFAAGHVRGDAGRRSDRGARRWLPGHWPLTAGVVTYPWVIRDLDANTFTPVAAPPKASPSTNPATAPASQIAGFSPDGQRVYLSDIVRHLGLLGYSTGWTVEYHLVGNRELKRIPGFSSFVGVSHDSRRPVSALGLDRGLARPRTLCGRVLPLRRRHRPLDQARSRRSACSPPRPTGRTLVCRRSPCPLLCSTSATTSRCRCRIRSGPAGWTRPARWRSSRATRPRSCPAAPTPTASTTFRGRSAVAARSRQRRARRSVGIAMGLDYTSGAGVNGAPAIPMPTASATRRSSPPARIRAARRRFLAEGADNAFFKTRLAHRQSGRDAGDRRRPPRRRRRHRSTINVHVPAGARRTVLVDELAGHAPSFSTVVESERAARRRSDHDVGRTDTALTPRSASGAPSHVVVPRRGRHRRLLAVLPAAESGDDRRDRQGALPAAGALRAGRAHLPAAAALARRRCRSTRRRPSWPPPTCRRSSRDAADHRRARDVLTRRGQLFAAGHASAGVTAPAPAGSWPRARPAPSSICSCCSPTRRDGGRRQVRYLLTTGAV